MRRREIRSDLPPDTLHREDFQTCPHCGRKYKYEIWDGCAFILIASIPITSHMHKKGNVIIVSECPRCFGYSWCHEDYFHVCQEMNAPKEWIDKMQEAENEKAG